MDVGSSSVRGMLADGQGLARPGTRSRFPYEIARDPDGCAEIEPELLVGLVERVVAKAIHGIREPVAAVGVSAFWHSLIGLDERGTPTTPVLLWSDTRAWRQAEQLRDELDPAAVRGRTGAPIHPCYWPAKLVWLHRSQPAVWRRTRHWVSFPDLLFLRWFGQLGTSRSMASGTGLLGLAGGWDPELLERVDLDPARLPDRVEEMSGLRPPYANRWPQLRRIPWLTARGDGALANLGSGCLDPSRRALTLGTSGAIRVVTARPPRSLAPGLWCYMVDHEQYLVGGSLSNGGNLWAWMERTLRLDRRGLEGRLRRLSPGSGPDFLALLAGERSPGFAPRARGALAGLTLTTTPEEIARAGMEAVAVAFARVDAALDRSVPGAGELVGGGGALHASPVWAQMLADATGKPVTLAAEFEASLRGAALIALARAGIRVPSRPRGGRLVRPDPDAHRAYKEVAKRQAHLYELLI
ncbi:MAG: gluconokinase [Candidatus Dormibacteraeota bacterium]|nr:gluconokinase [Candidatus Dormibacteraeota bacterium]